MRIVRLVALLGAIFIAGFATSLQAAENLLVNGDFEDVVMTNGNALHSTRIGNGELLTDVFGDPIPNSTLPEATGWRSDGYAFVFMDNPGYFGGSPQTLTGADDLFDGAYTRVEPSAPRFQLWGPDTFGESVANGLTNSPTGGNFLASDGAFLNAPISQTLTNLNIGQKYHLTFWWAAAQQTLGSTAFGFNGDTTEAWIVCFGTCTYTSDFASNGDGYSTFDPGSGEIYMTDLVSNPNHGFTPWQYEHFEFTATTTTQTLSLLAYGTPLGQPPFALLDGVELSVPEPTTWAMMMIGFGVIGGVMRTRRRPVTDHRGRNAQII